jgi:hypothetical protein
MIVTKKVNGDNNLNTDVVLTTTTSISKYLLQF